MKTKICTTIEQSKKLMELGIDVNTADMFWGLNKTLVAYPYPYNEDRLATADKTAIPAWSLSALMQLLPSDFTEEGKFGTFTYEIHIRKYRFTADIDVYQIAYGNYARTSDNWKDMINTGEKEELLDAAFKMIVWLKENNKI